MRWFPPIWWHRSQGIGSRGITNLFAAEYSGPSTGKIKTIYNKPNADSSQFVALLLTSMVCIREEMRTNVVGTIHKTQTISTKIRHKWRHCVFFMMNATGTPWTTSYPFIVSRYLIFPFPILDKVSGKCKSKWIWFYIQRFYRFFARRCIFII